MFDLLQRSQDLGHEFCKEEGYMPDGWYELLVASRRNATSQDLERARPGMHLTVTPVLTSE